VALLLLWLAAAQKTASRSGVSRGASTWTAAPHLASKLRRSSLVLCAQRDDEVMASLSPGVAPALPPETKDFDVGFSAQQLLKGQLVAAGAERAEVAKVEASLSGEAWDALSRSSVLMDKLNQRLVYLKRLLARKHDAGDFAEILAACPALLTNDQQLQKLESLLRNGLTLQDVAMVLKSRPGFLSEVSESAVEEVLTCLTMSGKNPLADVTTIPPGLLASSGPSYGVLNATDALGEAPLSSTALGLGLGLGLRRQDARRLLRSAPGLLAAQWDKGGLPSAGMVRKARQKRAGADGGAILPRKLSKRRKAQLRMLDTSFSLNQYLENVLNKPSDEGTQEREAPDAQPPNAYSPPAERQLSAQDIADEAFRAYLEEEEASRMELQSDCARGPFDEPQRLNGADQAEDDGSSQLGRGRWEDAGPRERLERSAKTLAALGLGSKTIRQDARRPPKARPQTDPAKKVDAIEPLRGPVLPTLLQTPTSMLFRFAACLAAKDVNVAPQTLSSLLKEAPGLPSAATAPAEPDSVGEAMFCAELIRNAPAALQAGMADSGVDFLERCVKEWDDAELFSPESPMVMEAPIQFLIELGVDAVGSSNGVSGLDKAIRAEPALLVADVPRQMAPVYMFLSVDLKLGVQNTAGIVARYPALLLKDVETELRPLARLFCSLAGLEQGSPDTTRVLRAFPSLLALDPEQDIFPVVNTMRDVLRCSTEDLSYTLRALPSLLGYDVRENLWPKLEYLFGYCRLDPKHVLNGFPAALSYPLISCIEPRFEFLAARETLGKGSGGYNAADAATPSESWATQEFSREGPTKRDGRSSEYIMNQVIEDNGGLGSILARGDDDFARRVAKVPSYVYLEFKKGYLERRDMLIKTRGTMDPHVYKTARNAGLL